MTNPGAVVTFEFLWRVSYGGTDLLPATIGALVGGDVEVEGAAIVAPLFLIMGLLISTNFLVVIEGNPGLFY